MAPVASKSWPYWEIEHRREFSNLRNGIHLPGYTGYLPQFKFQFGDTYARSCEELSKTQIVRKPLPPIPPEPKPGLPEKREFNGLTKYMNKMVPGYSGYVPRRVYNYGENFNDDCNRCIGMFFESKEENDKKRSDFQSQVRYSRKLQPIATTEEVNEELKNYKTKTKNTTLIESKRDFLEAPLIGWTGYVPRIKVTDISLGKGRAAADQEGLLKFKYEKESRDKLLQEPVNPERKSEEVPSWAKNSKPLYVPNGMKPRYTGYVPHRRFIYGKTYGEMTRGVSVCAKRKIAEDITAKNF